MSPPIHAGAFDLQGHRGARGHAPENTLPGFERALAFGVTTFELDVGVSRDAVVVIHRAGAAHPRAELRRAAALRRRPHPPGF